MKKIDFFREIGEINEDYLKEAEEYRKAKVLKGNFKRYVVAAASLILCLGIGYAGMRQFEPKGEENGTAQMPEKETHMNAAQPDNKDIWMDAAEESDYIVNEAPADDCSNDAPHAFTPSDNNQMEEVEDVDAIENEKVQNAVESTDDRNQEYLSSKGEQAGTISLLDKDKLPMVKANFYKGGGSLHIYEVVDQTLLDMYDVYDPETMDASTIAELTEADAVFLYLWNEKCYLFVCDGLTEENLADMFQWIEENGI